MGFTSILIDGHTYASLNKAISKFCLEREIKSLHARKLEFIERKLSDMDEYADVYSALFNLVHEHLKRANYTFLSSVLLSKSDLDQCYTNLEKSFKSQCHSSRKRDLELSAKAYSYIAFPTVELARRIRSDGQLRFEIHVDRKDEYEAVLANSVSVNGELLDVEVAVATLLNAFIKQRLRYPINIRNVEIAAFDRCPLVSVVDAFANFIFSPCSVDPLARCFVGVTKSESGSAS